MENNNNNLGKCMKLLKLTQYVSRSTALTNREAPQNKRNRRELWKNSTPSLNQSIKTQETASRSTWPYTCSTCASRAKWRLPVLPLQALLDLPSSLAIYFKGIAWYPCTPSSTRETCGKKNSPSTGPGKEIAGLLKKMKRKMKNMMTPKS